MGRRSSGEVWIVFLIFAALGVFSRLNWAEIAMVTFGASLIVEIGVCLAVIAKELHILSDDLRRPPD